MNQRAARGNAARTRVAAFWDDVLSQWHPGEEHLDGGALRRWYESYRGRGSGAVDLAHYPDPYVGDLRGARVEPRLVILGLNPGTGYDVLQGDDGTWTRRIREQTYSGCIGRSPALDPETWVGLHGGPSRYWSNIERFARRWLADDSAGAADVLNMELYPWHSRKISGVMAPPSDVLDEFVWSAVAEVAVPEVFAFGAPWFAVCDALGLEVVARYGGRDGTPLPEAFRAWRLAVHRLPSGQLVVASSQSGYAGPPGAERLALLRSILDNLQEAG